MAWFIPVIRNGFKYTESNFGDKVGILHEMIFAKIDGNNKFS